MLVRHYVLKDRYGLSQPSGRFREQNAVFSGQSTAINATSPGNSYDYSTAGNQSNVFSQYQTFMGITASGAAVPL